MEGNNMSAVSGFFRFTEIMTKITSVFAFALSVAYLFYLGQPLRWPEMGVFFASMFLFDLTTTAINNYIDSRTNGQVLPFSRPACLKILLVLLGTSTFLGLWLVFLTDWVVLLAGGLCFLAGILYTWGPLPVSRMPLGEVVSGVFYGLLIPFLILYINMPEGSFLKLTISWPSLTLEGNLRTFGTLFLLSVAPVLTTAGIMLANNISDLDRDVQVGRYTLAYYLGRSSLKLFAGIYYLIYPVNLLMVFLGIMHPVGLFLLVTLIPVHRNIREFIREQNKETTFLVSIRNYILIMGAQTFLMVLGGFLGGRMG